jgi:hypothetical protein
MLTLGLTPYASKRNAVEHHRLLVFYSSSLGDVQAAVARFWRFLANPLKHGSVLMSFLQRVPGFRERRF